MKIELEQVSPHEIEKRSFEIITEELNGRTFPEDQELVVKRCIHTSADFDYADNLCFSDHAVAKGIEAIRGGACIVTDTQMARSGINKKVLARHGGEALCFMSDEDVAARAKETGSTRAAACMEKAAELDKNLIIAVGNAPTALVRLYELIGEGKNKTSADYWCAGRLCQCRTVQRTHYADRYPVYRGTRPERRQQYRSVYLQCAPVYDGSGPRILRDSECIQEKTEVRSLDRFLITVYTMEHGKRLGREQVDVQKRRQKAAGR